MAKRAYKLQEFAAHASNVNCLSIGKKSGRLLITGGEDCKVNLWAIGKTSSLLSLSGHTSSVESLTFDSAEVLVLSGASTGGIKLWDLEESKIVRTLTGHRSKVNAVEFHPFGEFFASGSSDTTLKLWDIRKKGCIHTYKGHTQGVSTIRFTPDGRWVVSGGADNVVKVWDLTAGKLLHELKFHEGQIQCIDFHPLEFLLATGSADRTVNFWDLETFELIGSAGPEATGVRSMAFHPDGRTLFCGLDDCLKVFSWEPIVCHDVLDMGWSTLGDLIIHEGKLLACSYYRNCVGVWAADISFIEPYGVGASPRPSGIMEHKVNRESHSAQKPGSIVKSSTGLLTNPHYYETTEIKNIYVDTTDSRKIAPKRVGLIDAPKRGLTLDSYDTCNPSPQKAIPRPETHERTSSHVTSRPFTPPVIVPRNSPNADRTIGSRRESITTAKTSPGYNPSAENTISSRRESITPARTSPGMLRKSAHTRRPSNTKEAKLSVAADSGGINSKTIGLDSAEEPKFHFKFFSINEHTKPIEEKIKTVAENFERVPSPDVPLSSSHENCAEERSCSTEMSSTKHVNRAAEEQNCSIGMSSEELVNRVLPVRPGRTRSLVERWERREICTTSTTEAPTTSTVSDVIPETETQPPMLNGQPQSERESTCTNDEDVIEGLMQSHDIFLSDLRSRLTKLQVVRHFWQRNDVKGGINAVGKLPDHSVQADVVTVLVEKMEIVTLDLFSCLLPLFLGLLNSKMDRHTNVSLEMLLKLVAIFGPRIRSTISASPSVGVDLQAERRREFCNQCFILLQKIKQLLPSVIRRGGLLAKGASELNLVLQEL